MCLFVGGFISSSLTGCVLQSSSPPLGGATAPVIPAHGSSHRRPCLSCCRCRGTVTDWQQTKVIWQMTEMISEDQMACCSSQGRIPLKTVCPWLCFVSFTENFGVSSTIYVSNFCGTELAFEAEAKKKKKKKVGLCTLHKSSPAVINWMCLRINASCVSPGVFTVYVCVRLEQSSWEHVMAGHGIITGCWDCLGTEQNRSRCQHTHLQSTASPEA